jgi:hypothetical protein
MERFHSESKIRQTLDFSTISLDQPQAYQGNIIGTQGESESAFAIDYEEEKSEVVHRDISNG